jgi:hypothetical protein
MLGRMPQGEKTRLQRYAEIATIASLAVGIIAAFIAYLQLNADKNKPQPVVVGAHANNRDSAYEYDTVAHFILTCLSLDQQDKRLKDAFMAGIEGKRIDWVGFFNDVNPTPTKILAIGPFQLGKDAWLAINPKPLDITDDSNMAVLFRLNHVGQSNVNPNSIRRGDHVRIKGFIKDGIWIEEMTVVAQGK